MKIKEVIVALEKFAPLPLQDGFDNAGLQVGMTEAEITGALLCLDVTEAVVTEAITLGCNLIVSHHPLIFKGYKSITGRDYVERCIMRAIKHDLVIYAAHTNLDNAPQGVNYKMAQLLGLKNVRILAPKEESLVKLVTFVPSAHLAAVESALYDAGCGTMGNYDSCSFQTAGKGTFRALPGSAPFCGTIHEIHVEEEIRIETILPAFKKGAALKALLAAHPYEEPAFDFLPLQNSWKEVGAGAIGELEEPVDEMDFLKRVKELFHVDCLKYNGLTGREIKRVALCGGAGSFLLPRAMGQADVFITGEVKYHDYFAYEKSLLIAEIGHYESEQYTQELFYSIIRDAFPALELHLTQVCTNPINCL
ncbi:MAG: Nif3-like dinuclear metal center hexameric protein [Phocaeicola sp.]